MEDDHAGGKAADTERLVALKTLSNTERMTKINTKLQLSNISNKETNTERLP